MRRSMVRIMAMSKKALAMRQLDSKLRPLWRLRLT